MKQPRQSEIVEAVHDTSIWLINIWASSSLDGPFLLHPSTVSIHIAFFFTIILAFMTSITQQCL